MNWEQLKTILWLRWRLTRNQLFRGSSIGGALVIVLGILGVSLMLTLCAGATALGYITLRNANPDIVMVAWMAVVGVFLFLWLLGLLTELQRSETIDLQRLMHLPVRLGQVFVINFVVSHVSFTLMTLLPAMLGLALGLTLSRSPIFLVLVPLLLSVVFMVTAWTYCLRGWLATLMSNPRRRRTIVMCLTLGIILLGQAPNIYFNIVRRGTHRPPRNQSTQERSKRQADRRAEGENLLARSRMVATFIPPMWLPLGARAAAEGNPLPALLAMLGCAGIGAMGLRRAYQNTIRFYHGNPARQKGRPATTLETAPSKAAQSVRSRLLEIRLPLVPEPAAAVAGATLRSMMRAPEVKMTLGTSALMVLIFGGIALMRATPKIPDVGKPFLATGAVALSLFMVFQFVANQFGLDRDGFRVLVMSPVNRKHLLLGKNLACLPVAAGFGLLLVLILSAWLALPPQVVLAALLQLLTMALCTLTYGNLLSILLPFRIQAGALKPTKPPFLKMLALMVCQFFLPLTLLPGALPPLADLLWRSLDGSGWIPVNLLFSLFVAGAACVGYWLALEPLSNLYMRREQAILTSVTSESE